MKNVSAYDLMGALVGYPTVSRDSNLNLIDFVAEFLKKFGVRSYLVSNEDNTKANLYATIGPEVEGGIIFSGHTDVVPIDGQAWNTDPFKLVEKDNKFYGRGAVDMKGFLAIVLSLLPEMQKLQKPVHLAFSYDEEVGCQGAPAMIQAMAENVPKPQAVLVGEPTGMEVITAHKGLFYFETHVVGYETHSSQQHRGVSAVMAAAELVHWLGNRQNDNALNAEAGCCSEPPYTTLHCGQIEGGTAQNITARHCRFITDIRSLPGESPLKHFDAYLAYVREVVEPRMQAIHKDTHVNVVIQADVPGFQAYNDEPAVQLVQKLSGQNSCGEVSFGSEAGQFHAAGFSTVLCGPGSIDQAHQPNEFIARVEVESGVALVRNLVSQLSA